ncbi:DUF4097 family beta strand repeat-containing protein [Hominifimenecus sp. rT4P-3]|uniref:DUF4097 family beta strand repeat-containing protein n=1 Tax=Hominifimenecus sp. rT4P-3 TaxID=3242979 RepID=UPI003DA69224
MRKGVKRLIIIGVILFAIGLIGGGIAFAVGLTTGSLPRGRWGYFRDFGVHIEKTYEADTIRRVEVDMGAGQVEICRGDQFSIYGEGLYTNFRNEVVDGTWYIGQSEDRGFWDFFGAAGEVVLTIPEDVVLSEVVLSVGAGELDAEVVHAGQLTISCGAGQISVEEAKAEQIDVTCGVGEVDLSLCGKESDYHPNVSCSVGKVTIGEHKYSERHHDTHGANANLNVYCGVGNVEISFLP